MTDAQRRELYGLVMDAENALRSLEAKWPAEELPSWLRRVKLASMQVNAMKETLEAMQDDS